MTGAPAGADELPAWRAQLAAQRATFNTSLARARAAGAPRDVLERALRELGPSVESLAETLPGAALDEVCRTLVDVVGDLAVRKLWHDRSEERLAVLTILPALAGLLARSPRTTTALVVAGAARIGRGADLTAWGRRIAAAAPHLTDDDELRHAGTVAAWRSGLVRARRAAHTSAAAVPDAALAHLLDLPAGAEPRAALARNAADPFAWPASPDSGPVARFGAFRGFGGTWVAPAVVTGTLPAATPTWTLDADGSRWLILADAHGHAILRDPIATGDGSGGTAASGDTPADAVRAGGADTSTLVDVLRLLPGEDSITGLGVVGRATLVSRAASYRLDLVLVPA